MQEAQGDHPGASSDAAKDACGFGGLGGNSSRPASRALTAGTMGATGGLDATLPRGAGAGHLGLEVSGERGRGEDSMTSFIQAHLQSILKPFAQHVDDLHGSLDQVRLQVQQAVSVSERNSARLDEFTGQVGDLRENLGRTAQQASTTQQGLHKLVAETAELSTLCEKTKAALADVDGRLRDSEVAVAELHTNLKGTRSSLGKLREGLSKLERDVAVRIGPTMDKLLLDLKHLDTSHQGTVQSLGETRSFTQCVHQAFQVFEKESEQRQGGIDRRFEHVEGEFGKVGRDLKGLRDMDQLQEDHLNTIEATVAPTRQRLEQLEGARDEGRRRHHHFEKAVTDIQVQCNSMGVDVAKLMDFLEEMKQGGDIFDVLEHQKKELAQHTVQIRTLSETSGSYCTELQKQDQRATALEKAQGEIKQQTSKLSERLGTVTPAHSRSPSREPREFRDAAVKSRPRSMSGHYDYKDSIPANQRVPMIMLRALDKLSISARQKRAIDQINEHSRELANTTTSLTKTACHLDNTETRVSNLEGQLASMTDEMKKISMALDLNQEYWKGLSKGLKETNRSVVEGEVLLPRGNGMKLPVISRPPSCQHQAPCIMSAR